MFGTYEPDGSRLFFLLIFGTAGLGTTYLGPCERCSQPPWVGRGCSPPLLSLSAPPPFRGDSGPGTLPWPQDPQWLC